MPRLALTLTTALLFASTAYAGPGDDFLADLNKELKAIGAEASVGSISESANGFSLDRVAVKGKNGNAGVSEIRVDGFEKSETGFVADSIAAKGLAIALQSDMTMTIENVTATGLNVSEATLLTPSFLGVFETYIAQNMIFKLSGLSVAEMETSAVKTQRLDDGSYVSTTNMQGIVFDVENMPVGPAMPAIRNLGYGRINANVAGALTYNPTTGALALKDTAFNVENVANLQMSYSVLGYTHEVSRKLSEWTETYGEDSRSPEASAAMLEALSGIQIESASFTIRDQSITAKLLDLQANIMGSTGDQLAQTAPLLLGMGLARLEMPEFTGMVTKAVGHFLQTKGALTVSIAPDEPVSLESIETMSQSDPRAVIGLLNLRVTAVD